MTGIDPSFNIWLSIPYPKMDLDQRRLDKIQEDLERQRDEYMREYICEQYGVSEVTDLRSEDKEDIEKFMDSSECPDFWLPGFSSVLNDWENENG